MPCTLTNIGITRDYGFALAVQTNACDFRVPTNGIAVKSLSMPTAKEFIDASGARGTHEILANDYLEGMISYEGEVSFPAIPNFLPMMLIAAYGSKTTNQATTNLTRYKHDNNPSRLSLEGDFGRATIQWSGVVVNELGFTSSPGSDLEVTARFMARRAVYTNTPSYSFRPTRTQRAFQHANATVTVYGTELPMAETTLTIARSNVNKFYGNSNEPEELIVERPTEVTGSFKLPWSTQADTIFDNFRGFTMGQIVLSYVRGSNTLKFTMPQVVIESGPAASLSGLAVQEYDFQFKALAPTNTDSCKIELTSTA
jgi:hypothetical protein